VNLGAPELLIVLVVLGVPIAILVVLVTLLRQRS